MERREQNLRELVYSRFAVEAVFGKDYQTVDRWRVHVWGGDSMVFPATPNGSENILSGLNTVMDALISWMKVSEGIDEREAARAVAILWNDTARWTLARQRRALIRMGRISMPVETVEGRIGLYVPLQQGEG